MFKIAIVGNKEITSTLSSLTKKQRADAIPFNSLQDCLEILRIEKFDCVIIQEQHAEILEDQLVNDLNAVSPHLAIIVILKKRDLSKALYWMNAGVHECLYEPLNLEESQVVIKKTILSSDTHLSSQFSFLNSFLSSSQDIFGKIVKSSILILSLFILIWGGQKIYRIYSRQTESSKTLPLSFKLPYPNPTGIAWDGKNLLITDWSTQTVYKHKINANLDLEKFYNTAAMPVLSLTVGNGMIWTIGQDNNIRQHSINGKLISMSVFPLNGETPSALAWDGKHLWTCDARARKIYRHIPDEQLTLVSAYNFPGKKPVGMVWDKNDLWIADEEDGAIYCFNFDGTSFTLIKTLRPEMHAPGSHRLSGIAFDGNNFWTISEGSGMIFRHSAASFKGESTPN